VRDTAFRPLQGPLKRRASRDLDDRHGNPDLQSGDIVTQHATRAASTQAPPDDRVAPSRLRHPLAAWLTVVLAVVYGALGVPRLLGHRVPAGALEPVLSILAFGVLFGGAVVVTGLADGRDGVRRLFSGLVRWRIGVLRWLLVVAALPTLTLGIAAATGSFRAPADGWTGLVVGYGLGLLTGLLLTSLWEEAGWSGLVQRRLMRGRGLLASACLTAVPFVLVHVPGAFQGAQVGDAVVNVVAITLLAPVLRYLAGVLLLETGGSVLAVAVLHASFNTSGHLAPAVGGWQLLAALPLLAGAVAVHRRLRGRTKDVVTPVT
jgi:membrane protease YdiL (CAAX protease family)